LPFEDEGFAPHWHGSPFISHFWSALSQAFGPGERFFIDSVRHWKDRIDDPELREEIDAFSQQEALHTLQHRKFNRMVGEHGYDVERMEARYAAALEAVREEGDPLLMLSVTTALEHFTAGFAHRYLSDASIAEGADPNVEALWAWHAAEEAEHKATAFDVYEAVGGGYLRRVTTLGPAWLLILGITLRNVQEMLEKDGRQWDLRDQLRGLAYLFGPRGLVTGMLPGFLRYLSPRFHPWSEDDSELIARWEAASRGSAGPAVAS
jgi:predicted metal-dependent hydrolase